MADDEVFMERPTEVYREWLHRGMIVPRFEEGRMAMALEIISLRKSLEAVGIMGKGVTIGALDTLLADQELLDEADALYVELCEWRKIRFRDVSSGEPRPSSGGSHSRAPTRRLGSPTLRPQDRKTPPSS